MSTTPFVIQLQYTSYCLHKNLEGVSHDESLRQPDAAGNCLNWVVGHIVGARHHWLEGLGAEGVLSDEAAELYRRGGEPLTDEDAAVPLEELVAAYDLAQERLSATLGAMTDEQLDALAPFSPGNNPEETWRSLNAGLCFHEAYHVGQSGILRRLLGKPGMLT